MDQNPVQTRPPIKRPRAPVTGSGNCGSSGFGFGVSGLGLRVDEHPGRSWTRSSTLLCDHWNVPRSKISFRDMY